MSPASAHPGEWTQDDAGHQHHCGNSGGDAEELESGGEQDQANALRISPAGAREETSAPRTTPGMLPRSREAVTSSRKSPNKGCPSAATATSGTAWTVGALPLAARIQL